MSRAAPTPAKEMIKACKSGDFAHVKALLASDRDLLHARDTDESTPLDCASWKGHREIVALLLSSGADVNAKNFNDHLGNTPIHAAAHANQAAIVELLLAHGAESNARDAAGRTPLDHTKVHNAKEAAKALEKLGAGE